MKVVVTRSFGSYRRGMQFDWAPAFAKILIRRGLIESIEMPDEIETAEAPEPVVERAVAKKPRRKKRVA